MFIYRRVFTTSYEEAQYLPQQPPNNTVQQAQSINLPSETPCSSGGQTLSHEQHQQQTRDPPHPLKVPPPPPPQNVPVPVPVPVPPAPPVHPTILSPPYIQAKEPLFRLAMEYANPTFQHNIFNLRDKGVKWIARTRGDGNCFYRAFAFLLLNYVFVNKAAPNHNCITQAILRLKLEERWANVLRSESNQSNGAVHLDNVWNELRGCFQQCMVSMEQFDRLENEAQLVQFINDPSHSQHVVAFLRMATALEMMEKRDDFAPYTMQLDPDILHYVVTRVLSMDQEAEQMEITALASFLTSSTMLAEFNRSVNVTILYLDGNPRDMQEYSYCINQKPAAEDAEEVSSLREHMYLLYRSGHYDALL